MWYQVGTNRDESFQRVARGLGQIRLAQTLRPQYVLAWGYLGIDNIISGLLVAKSLAYSKKHLQKLEEFLWHFPDASERIPRIARLETYCKLWNQARYEGVSFSDSQASDLMGLANDVIHYAQEELSSTFGKSADELADELEVLAFRELHPAVNEAIFAYSRHHLEMAEAEAESYGYEKFAIRSTDPLLFTDMDAYSDDDELRKLLVSDPGTGELLVKLYDTFIELVERGIDHRWQRLQEMEEEDLAREIYNFNLHVSLTFRSADLVEHFKRLGRIVRDRFQTPQRSRGTKEEKF